MDNTVPKKIYLAWYDDDGEPRGDSEDLTWCKDMVNATDEMYVHISEVEQLRKEKEWLFNYCLEVVEAEFNVDRKQLIFEMQEALKEKELLKIKEEIDEKGD